MRYREITAIILLIFATTTATAQSGTTGALRFNTVTIDYGTIAEEGGMVTRYIEAVNSGSSPLHITDVITSCGCTHAEYRRDAIMPNDTVCIGITFDPRDRPGRFEREAMVVTSEDKRYIIEIIGRVTPRERSIYEIYPFDMGGGLRMESNFHAFAYIEHGKEVEERIAYINNSDKSITLDIAYKERSGALTIEHPTTIAPHDKGDIILRYALDEESARYGTLSDIFQMVVDGACNSTMVSTYAIAVDNFDLMEDILAPSMVVSKKIIKFGEVLLDNKILEQSITLSNSGESPLIIRCIESDSPAITVEERGGREMAKGATTTLTIRLDTAMIKDVDNPFVSRIRVICNDPLSPMQVIKVNAIPIHTN